MKQLPSQEEVLLLPPWSQKRRRFATVIMFAFILISAALIGLGIYQIGIERGVINPPLNKQQLTRALLNDGSFIRAVRRAGAAKECINTTSRFKLTYFDPFVPLSDKGEDACHTFVALHPTGADVLVKIKSIAQARYQLVQDLSAAYTSVQADMISGTGFETSRLYGLRDGIMTTTYVIGIGPNTSWVVTYAPQSPSLDSNVLLMVEKFRPLN